MPLYAIETEKIFGGMNRHVYILNTPDSDMAKNIVLQIIDDSYRISDADTLNNVAGVNCSYIEVEISEEKTYDRPRNRGTSRRSSGRNFRKQRIPVRTYRR